MRKGQATIELMLILPLLLIILGISMSIFSQQTITADAIQIQHEAQRTAETMATALEEVGNSVPGSTLRIFLPPTIETQTILIQNGSVEVQSARGFGSARLTNTNWSASAFSNGQFVSITLDTNRVLGVNP